MTDRPLNPELENPPKPEERKPPHDRRFTATPQEYELADQTAELLSLVTQDPATGLYTIHGNVRAVQVQPDSGAGHALTKQLKAARITPPPTPPPDQVA